MSLVRIADAAELAAFLAAHPDVRAVQIMITDPSGVYIELTEGYVNY